MLEYLDRTAALRKSTQLFISTLAPHGPISRDTLSRWIKDTLIKSGIDMSIFTPHSTRSASTSAAAKGRVPLSTILKTAGWSNANTFNNYYKKCINGDTNFSKTLLSTSVKTPLSQEDSD